MLFVIKHVLILQLRKTKRKPFYVQVKSGWAVPARRRCSVLVSPQLGMLVFVTVWRRTQAQDANKKGLFTSHQVYIQECAGGCYIQLSGGRRGLQGSPRESTRSSEYPLTRSQAHTPTLPHGNHTGKNPGSSVDRETGLRTTHRGKHP